MNYNDYAGDYVMLADVPDQEWPDDIPEDFFDDMPDKICPVCGSDNVEFMTHYTGEAVDYCHSCKAVIKDYYFPSTNM